MLKYNLTKKCFQIQALIYIYIYFIVYYTIEVVVILLEE